VTRIRCRVGLHLLAKIFLTAWFLIVLIVGGAVTVGTAANYFAGRVPLLSR
jgi:hypothetical protein